jgi:CTP:molybdopterin cytidylyltransferase MocA
MVGTLIQSVGSLGPMQPRVAGILLAAGEGSRLGQPKALVEIAGQRLVDRGLRMLRAGGADPVVVVTGAAPVDVPGALVVHNPAWPTGMGSSLAAGLSALRALPPDECSAALIALADQPLVSPACVKRLIAAHRGDANLARGPIEDRRQPSEAGAPVSGDRRNPAAAGGPRAAGDSDAGGGLGTTGGVNAADGLGVAADGLGVAADGLGVAADGLGVAADGLGVAADGLGVIARSGPGSASIAVAAYGGRPRNPVLIAREHWAEVLTMAHGDTGARPFLRAHPDLITLVECGDIGRPDDIDTPEDLVRVAKIAARLLMEGSIW